MKEKIAQKTRDTATLCCFKLVGTVGVTYLLFTVHTVHVYMQASNAIMCMHACNALFSLSVNSHSANSKHDLT